MPSEPTPSPAPTPQAAPEPAPTPRPAPRTAALPLAVGVAGGILGLLPWVIGGGTLPLQNLWSPVMPEDMPFVLLPISQYSALLVFSLLLLGGVFTGAAVHLVGRRAAFPALTASLGLLLVQAIAVAQSFLVLYRGLGLADGYGGPRQSLYFFGMLGGALGAVVLAQVGLWMVSRRSAGVAAFGVALAAVPFGNWVWRCVVAFTGEATAPMFLPDLLRWVPAIVVGLALVWCGVRPYQRIAVWIVSLLALGVLPALFGAIQYGLGMRVLDGDVAAMASSSIQVFPLMLAQSWLPVLVAAVIAVAGTAVRMLGEFRRARRIAAAEG